MILVEGGVGVVMLQVPGIGEGCGSFDWAHWSDTSVSNIQYNSLVLLTYGATLAIVFLIDITNGFFMILLITFC